MVYLAKPDPVAEHVAAVLRQRILGRAYRDVLPPIAMLADEFKCSETTIRRAEKLLADAHLVVVSNGRRPRVTPGPRDTLWDIQQELGRVIKELDALREHVGALSTLLGPYVNYPDEETMLAPTHPW